MDDAQTDAPEARIVEAVRLVLNGFNEGLFMRSTKGDDDPAWAIKLFPYLRALGTLQEWFDSGAALASPRTPEPSGKLCCAMLTIQGSPYVCNLPLEHGGEHHGEHADPAHHIQWDDHREWPHPAASPPDRVRIEKLSALARECAVTLCYYPEADGGPIYSVIHRKIRDGATLCEAIDATEHGS